MEDKYLDVLKQRFVYLYEVGEDGEDGVDMEELDAVRTILRLWDISEVDGYEV